MIIFEKLRFKNFLSTGNNFTEVDFEMSPTTLVVGHNGAGKSTMLDALSFGLFGKSHRKISKPQLVNSINQKGLLVEVEFRIGSQKYKIVRGIKPNKFVKIIVSNKGDPYEFERFVDRVQAQKIHELKIAEDFKEFIGENVEDESISVEDTQTLVFNYIDAVNTDLDKSRIKKEVSDLMTEAQSMEIV